MDIGAYIGDVTQQYREIFTNSFIYSFEPFKDSYSKLHERFRTDKKIETINSAISEESGFLDFNVNENFRTNSLLELDLAADKNWPSCGLKHDKKEVVNSYSLDDFLKFKNIDNIDLLKIDAQGYEFYILKGAYKSLVSSKIKIIYLEVILKPTYKDQAKFDEILKYLYSLNYSLFDLYNKVYFNDGSLRQMDVIFVENNFLQKL